nr:MAG TPA: hypothetical protein [Caudoviricetes sp.]
MFMAVREGFELHYIIHFLIIFIFLIFFCSYRYFLFIIIF